MAALHRNRQLTFPVLRDGLGLTPGNLGAHLARLEEAGYLESRRILAGVSFEMRYRITAAGSEAFVRYVRALRAMLEGFGAAEAWTGTDPRAGASAVDVASAVDRPSTRP